MCVDMDVLLCVFVKRSTSLCLLDKTLAVFTKESCVAPPQALGVLPSSPKANNWNGNEGTSALRSASESNETSHYFKIKTHTHTESKCSLLNPGCVEKVPWQRFNISAFGLLCSDHIKREEQKTLVLDAAINASRWGIDIGLNEQTPTAHHRKSIASWLQLGRVWKNMHVVKCLEGNQQLSIMGVYWKGKKKTLHALQIISIALSSL